MIRSTITTLLLLAIATLYGAKSNELEGYHPICSEVAQEVSTAWHEGYISREQATTIIDNCFAWQERQR